MGKNDLRKIHAAGFRIIKRDRWNPWVMEYTGNPLAPWTVLKRFRKYKNRNDFISRLLKDPGIVTAT